MSYQPYQEKKDSCLYHPHEVWEKIKTNTRIFKNDFFSRKQINNLIGGDFVRMGTYYHPLGFTYYVTRLNKLHKNSYTFTAPFDVLNIIVYHSYNWFTLKLHEYPRKYNKTINVEFDKYSLSNSTLRTYKPIPMHNHTQAQYMITKRVLMLFGQRPTLFLNSQELPMNYLKNVFSGKTI